MAAFQASVGVLQQYQVGRCSRVAHPTCTASEARGTAPRVAVVGGTGRVGEATIRSLTELATNPLHISICGRNSARGRSLVSDLTAATAERADDRAHTFDFRHVDTNRDDVLKDALSDCDVIVHTAGPFQRRRRPCEVLQVALDLQKDYVDVCDDLSHAQMGKKMHDQAVQQGISVWISTGIYPGVSNLMAAVAARNAPGRSPESVRFSYYTAGTGGIGPTVLASTFLILSEDVITYDINGDRLLRPPAGDLEEVDFGGKIGRKKVYLLNLPEVVSIREYLLGPSGGGEVLAKLSTDPPIWNWLLRATAFLAPRSLLRNQSAMQALSSFSLPVVRFTDKISGARTGIRVDVRFGPRVDGVAGTEVISVYEHETLRECVGDSTAAFTLELLYGNSKAPGVFYPEELNEEAAARILRNAARGADRFEVTQTEAGQN